MGIRTFSTLGDVLKACQIRYQEANVPADRPHVSALQELHEELIFTKAEIAYGVSEAAICEAIIFPILRVDWKPLRRTFAIWSHKPISSNEDLNGTPDFIFARKSELGKVVFDTPYVAVLEAKKGYLTLG